MEVSGYLIPDDLMYTKEHEWAKQVGSKVRVGITDYAAKTLNDVVYVTFPKVGGIVSAMKPMGTVESIKAVSELYSPLSGVVGSVNDALLQHPELVNKSPYGEGWIMEMTPDDWSGEARSLLDAGSYAKHLQSLLG